MKIIADQEKKCIGCGACYDICPKRCIDMKIVENNLTAIIEEDKCIHCGLCAKVCQVNKLPEKVYTIKCYAAIDDSERATSSSGGIATAISKYVINKGGIVIGCALMKDNEVRHIVVDNINDLQLLKKSKYVKSDVNGIYRKIFENRDKFICFIGTPCLCAAVRKYCETLNVNMDKILLVDLVCHGTPNQYVLKDCVNGNEIEAFRNNGVFELSFYNKLSKEDALYAKLYMMGFLHCLFYNQACYDCPYAESKRVGDITVGDFWVLQDLKKLQNIEEGVSLILVNTEKGEKIVEQLNINKEERTVEEACAHNGQLKAPSKKHKNNARFVKEYPVVGKVCLKRLLIKDRTRRKIREILFSNAVLKKIVLKMINR